MKSKIYQTKLTAKGLLATCLTPLELCKQPAPGSEMKKLIILLALFAAYLVPVNYAGAQIPCNWATDTVYPIPILDQATVTLGTNLYSFAGASNNVVTASSYKFNGSIWTPIAPLPAALEFPRAVTDGTDIYILGGFSSNTSTAQTSVYRYNVGSDSYTTLAPFTTGVWNESVVYLNGKIYKFCGTSLSSASTSVLEIYDIAGNSWTTGAPYPIALSYVSAIAEGNFIYAGGGLAAPATTPTLKTYRYDPGTDTWDDASIADLPQTRWGAAEAFYNTGFLMAGGYLNGTTTANISNSAISWDIATNTWITLPNMIGERARMTGAVLNGSFYVIGGRSIASSAFVGTNSNQQYSCCTVVPSITGDTIFCSGSSTILDAGLYTGYNWSTGATTQTISVNTAGTFTVSVTNGSGCTGSTSVTTTVNANPAPVISGSTSFCTGSSTTLDAGGGYTNYNWSTGATTQTITVSTTGTFTVTVTNGNGCTGTASTTTMVNPSPDVSVPADTTICNGTLLPMGTFNFSATGFDGKILIAYADVAGPPTQLRNALLSTPGVIQVDLFDASAGIPALTLMQQYHIVVPFSNNPYSDPVALGNNLADYVDSNGTVVGIGFTFYNSPYGPSGRWITGNYSPYIPGSGLEATTRTLGTFTSGHPLMAGVSVLTSNYHNVVPVAGGATEVAQWNNGHSLIAFKGRVVGITAYIGSQATWSGDFAKVIVNAGTWLNGNATISWTNNNTTIGLGASGTGSSLPTFTATNNTATSVTATITVTASNTNAGVTCTGSETFTITVNPSPDPIISGNLSFCAGSSTTLNAGAGYSGYNWSTGATTQTISVNTPGAFTVTVTDGSGCTGSDSATVTMNLPPPCLITGNGFFCPGSSLQLCAATNSSYLWSTGATTQCILVSTAGTYTVTVTNASGCTSSCSKTVFTYTAIPYTLTGSNFCSGDSTELCFVIIPSFGGNGYSLIWSTGATTDCIKTATGGTYTVTVTDQNGCTSSASITVVSYPPPACSIAGGNFCNGTSTQLCVNPVPGFPVNTYLWSTSATTQCITVTTSGTYTVTVTDGNGCTSSCSKTVVEYPKPACSISGNDFCSGSSTQLCVNVVPGPSGNTYLWSNGSTTQCITVTTGGTYTVTVTDANGCTSSCSKTVTAFTLPTCSITGSNFCQGGTSQLCAATNSFYLWSTGSTMQCITVSTGGTYTVTVSNADGCTSSCSKTVTAFTLPTCSITGSNFCQGGSSQLCAATNSSYLWSTGSTTQCIIVSTGGTYTVTVANADGCTSSCSKTVTAFTLPTCSITGSNFCQGGSSQLCAATNSSYLWSTGSTTQCIIVSTGGTYTVTVANADGCTSSCSKAVTAFTNPTCSITGGNFCQGGTSQLCAATNSGYLWSTGSTMQCITVSTGGTYTVTVSNADGCTSSCSKTVTAFTLPTCSITGSNFCQGGTSQLCAATNSSYLWSTGSTTQCITVSTGGTYTVTVSNADGCTSSCSKTVTAFTLPTCSITGSNFCQGGSSQLCAATNSSYLWSTGSTTQCITVSTGGTYTVTVTNANGCTSSCSKTVTAFTLPTCSITGSNFCQGGSSQLCAATNSSYLWSTGSTTQCIIVSTGGTYTVTVANSNGCTSSCSKTVTAFTLPTCSITGSNFCQGGSSQLCAATNSSYLWSTGSTTQCIIVSTGGTYTVTVANANGCTSSCSKTVTAFTLPTCSITGSNFCQGSSSQLCAATNSGYLWSTGATSQCITVTAGGTYTVTVTNANGCTSSCNKTVVAYALPTCAISGNIAYCQGSTTQLCGTPGMTAYLWSTGATTQCIAVAGGDYTVTVTNADGCTSSCSITTHLRLLPVCAITGNNFCNGSSTQLCATTAPAGYVFSYAWSTGATTQCITVTTGGTYTVNISNQYGCTSSCSKTIIVSPVPVCAISGNIAYCDGSTTQLCAPSGSYTYTWSTGATTQCIAAAGGDYTVTVTNADGCTSSCSITTHLRLLPVCAITGNNFCTGSSSQLCATTAPAGYVFSYSWSSGATTQCITVSTGGTYTVTITNQYGCYSSCSKTVTAYALPGCSITGNNSICQGSATQLCAATNSGYLWSTGATTQCITVTTGGTYRVTVTNANGCTSSCSKTITVKALPVCSITGNSSVCSGSSTQWCAASGFASYLWSTGSTTKCISVTAPGSYTVTVTNTNGCTSSCSKALTINLPPPPFTISGKVKICQGSSSQLCAPAGLAGYLWSNAKTTQCISVNTTGTYTVTVTNASGCTTKKSKKVTVNPLPACAITGNTAIHPGQSTNLCVAAVSGNAYLWNTGATTNCIAVNTVGDYTVTVTSNKGCTSSCTVKVTVSTAREGIDDGSANVAGNIEAKAFPNPFHSATTIEFKNNNSDAHLTVEIFNMTGERISVLFDGELSAGEVHQVKFDAANLGDGVYFYRITSGEAVLNGRIVLIRE